MTISLYHPTEEAFLCDHFSIARPQHLQGIEWDDSRLCVTPEELGIFACNDQGNTRRAS